MTRARWLVAGPTLALVLLLAMTVPGRAQAAKPEVHLAALTPAIEVDADLVVRLQSVSAPADAQLRITAYARTKTRSGFQQTLLGRNLGRPISPPIVVPASPDGTGVATVVIHTSAGSEPPALTFPEEGVFPMTIELLGAGNAVLSQLHTYVIRLPLATSDTAPLDVSMVARIGGRPALQPDGTVIVDSALRNRIMERVGVLANFPGVPYTVVPTPESLESLSAAGDAAPARALQAAAEGQQVVAGTYVDVDVSSWLQRGLEAELAQQLRTGVDVLTGAVGKPSSATWVANEPLTTDALRWLKRQGVRNVVLPDTGLSALDGRRFPATLTQPFQIEGADGVTAAVADAGLSSHVRSGGEPLVKANHLLADLAILYFDQPKAQRVAVIDLPDDIDSSTLSGVLAGVQAIRVLRATTLDAALSTVPVAGARGEIDGRANPLVRQLAVTTSGSLGSFPDRLRSAEADITTYQGALSPDDARWVPLQRRVLTTGASSFDDTRRRAYLDAVTQSVRGELAKVEAPARQSITFTARDGVVSYVVRNHAGYPITAVVRFQGTKVEFPDHATGTITTTLEGDSTRVELNVHTLTSGDSPVEITVATPDGRIVLARTRVTIRSTAFSGVGVVLSLGAGAFLVVWWGRTIIQSRRAQRRSPRHAAGAGSAE
jgi:hypothetical protein